MHKPPPKVHWHAYWMLAIGSGFLLLACAAILPSLLRDPREIRTSMAHGASFSFCTFIGALFVGIGIYAIRKLKD